MLNSDAIVIEIPNGRRFIIFVGTWFGPCMSGWTNCKIGNFDITPCYEDVSHLITHFPLSEYFVLLDAKYFQLSKDIEDFYPYQDLCSRFECEYFYHDNSGGDEYYPNGHSGVNYEYFICDYFNCRKEYLSFVDGINPEIDHENPQVLRYLLNDCITRELCSTFMLSK
jgi:hypothetical protein